MNRITIISLVFALAVSCVETIDKDNTAGGHQGAENPGAANVCVFDFTDTKNQPVEVTEVVVISEALEEYPLIIKLDKPSSVVQMDLRPKVNQIATYHFLVTGANGKSYHTAKDFYVPAGRRYEKSIALTKSSQSLLTDKSSWKVSQVKNGLTWYNLERYEPLTAAKQVINVLEMDIDSESLKLEFLYYPDRAKISEVANSDDGLVAITNASFGSGFTSGSPVDNTYIRVDGVTHREIGLSPDDSNYGKHESAVWYDGVSELGFIDMPGDLEAPVKYYKSTTYPNLFSSVPMLISDFNKVNLKSYKRKLSTTPGPLTALAVTCDRKLLLITVDGRWTDKAAGMTYTQLQDFLRIHFFPKYAINMDGGGSTCMYIKGKNVVNYPCEGGAGSGSYKEYPGTFKERGLVTFFAIREK